MIYLKLDATDSTNSFLRNLVREGNAANWTVVSTERQIQGRGQRGANWFSDENKNLTFSILIKDYRIKARDQFLLNCAVSNAVCKTLKDHGTPRLKVKWPNDIMSGASKIAGILIENSIMNDRVSHSIVGIGLNVNQEEFPESLPAAVSLLQLTGRTFDLDSLLRELTVSIEQEFKLFKEGKPEVLRENYQNMLFKKNTPHMFRVPEGDPFVGKILGVSDEGLLMVEKEDKRIGQYAFKEIEYL